MQHSILGSPQINSISDSSVVDRQTVKGQKAPQHLLDPVTTPPYINEYTDCKYWDVCSNDHEQNLNYCRLQEKSVSIIYVILKVNC